MADRATEPVRVDLDATVRRQNVRALLDDAASARLLRIAGRADLADTVERSGNRRLRRALLPAAAVLAAASAFLAASPASAQVITPPAVRVVLTGPEATVRLPLVATAPVGPHGAYGVTIARQSVTYGVAVGEAWSGSPFVDATVTAPSSDLVLGTRDGEVVDAGDGHLTKIPVTILRASRVQVGALIPIPSGAVGSVRVTHYEPVANRWTGAPYSPVLVQVVRAGRWATAATWTTDATGTAVGVVGLPTGARAVRFVCPDGARDAAASVTGTIGS